MANSTNNAVPALTGANEAQKVCNACGKSINAKARICPSCSVHQRTPIRKAGLLIMTLFFGGIGAHKFYLGKYWQGTLYLIFCWTGVPALAALVEFTIYTFTSSERLNERYSAKLSTMTAFILAFISLIFGMGILSMVVSAYQSYGVERAKAMEAIIMSEVLKTKITDAFKRHPSDMSCSLESCQLESTELGTVKYVRHIFSERTGRIIIEYDEQLFPAAQNKLSITPLIDGKPADLSDSANAGKTLSWRCGQDVLTTVAPQNLPLSCR